jgi:hypothetical protein
VKISSVEKVIALKGIAFLEDVEVQPYGEQMGHVLGFVGVVVSVNIELEVTTLLT